MADWDDFYENSRNSLSDIDIIFWMILMFCLFDVLLFLFTTLGLLLSSNLLLSLALCLYCSLVRGVTTDFRKICNRL